MSSPLFLIPLNSFLQFLLSAYLTILVEVLSSIPKSK